MFYIKSKRQKDQLTKRQRFYTLPCLRQRTRRRHRGDLPGRLRGSVRYKRLLPGVRGKPCPGDEGRKIRKPPRWAAVLRWGVQMVNLIYHRRTHFASVIHTGRANKRHRPKRSERNTDILVLWLACRRLVMQTARRWHRAFNGSRGVVLDDLEQVGFLALTKAAETWNPDSGAFSTWLTFQLKTAFAAAYFMRTERDRKDPLNDAVSLDTPPTGTDEDVMLRDIIPDAAAELALRTLSTKIFAAPSRSAVLSLPEDQRTVIIREFWYGQKPDPKTRSKAMKSLRRPSVSRALRTFC